MNIFVSYNSQNEDFADLLTLKLEKAGINVWKDSNNIQAGTEWRNEIDQGLIKCDILILLLNPISANSPYVTYEWAFALGRGKIIIPVIIEECKIHPRIDIFQYIDFKDKKRPWEKLINRIHEIEETNQKIAHDKEVLALKAENAKLVFEIFRLKNDPFQLNYPKQDKKVQRIIYSEGFIKDTKAKIWPIVKSVSGKVFWVQAQAEINDDGKWKAKVIIGSEANSDIGAHYQLVICINPKKELFEGAELTELPDCEYKSDFIEIIRK